MGCNSFKYSLRGQATTLHAAFLPHVASRLQRHLAKSEIQSTGAWGIQMLQPGSYCLKLPNVSSSCSHTEAPFSPKLLTSALSKTVFQSLLYMHICSFKELLHTKRCESTALEPQLLYWLCQGVEDVQITELKGTDCAVLSAKQEIVCRFKVSN